MALQQENAGPQFAIFGARRLALPSFLHVQTTATERALDAVTSRTEVVIRQRFLGPLFGYEGELEVQN